MDKVLIQLYIVRFLKSLKSKILNDNKFSWIYKVEIVLLNFFDGKQYKWSKNCN